MERINIDFEVLETKNPKKLMVGDTSRWLHSEELPAFIYITLPGSRKAIEYTFNKGGIEVFNSVSLKLNCIKDSSCDTQEYIDLPDGVYTILLQSGFEGISKKKYYLKTDKLTKEISKKLVNNLDNKAGNMKEALFNVWYLLEVSKAYVTEGNVPMTNRYYNEALDAFKCL